MVELRKLVAFLMMLSLAVVITYWDGSEVRRVTAEKAYYGEEGVSLSYVVNPADRNPRLPTSVMFPYWSIIRVDNSSNGKYVPWYRK